MRNRWFRQLFATAIFFLVLCFGDLSDAQEVSVIRGRLLNGTTAGEVRAEAVRLICFREGMEVMQSLEDVKGEFSFEGAFDRATPYMIQVVYQGVNYNEMFQLDETRVTQVKVTVFESTDSLEEIQVSLPHLLMRQNGKLLEVVWLYEIRNEGEVPRTYFDKKGGTFRFDLPEEIVGDPVISVSQGKMPLRQNAVRSPEGEGSVIFYPMKPGVTTVQLSYGVDLSGGSATFKSKVFYSLEGLDLLVAPASLQLTCPQFKDLHVSPESGYRHLRAEGIQAGAEFSFQVQAGEPVLSESESDPQVVTAHTSADRFRWPLLFGFFVVFSVSLFYAFQKGLSFSRTRRTHD